MINTVEENNEKVIPSFEDDVQQPIATDEKIAEDKMPSPEYKNQKDIDIAISKRLQAEREKLSKKYEGDIGMSKAIKERFPDLTDVSQLNEKLDSLQNETGTMDDLAATLLEQEQAIQEMDPEFDLVAELTNNPQALALLMEGANLNQVYNYMNMDKLIENARLDGERAAVEGIRSRRYMPSGNGSGGQNAVFDVDNLSQKEIDSIETRLRRGERVKLPK